MTLKDLLRAKENYRSRKQILDEHFGTKCILCGYEGKKGDRMTFHEVHFKSHPIRLWYYEQHLGDFILLCFRCHQAIHWLHDMYSLNWNEIVAYHKVLKDEQKIKKIPEYIVFTL